MSRRKQSKPQHVEFADDKNGIPANNLITTTTGGINQLVQSDHGSVLEQVVEANNSEFDDLNEEQLTNNPSLTKTDEKTIETENTESVNSMENESLMASTTNDAKKKEFEQSVDSTELEEFRLGQLALLHRSMLQPKYTSCHSNGATSESKDDMEQRGTTGDQHNVTRGEINETENHISENLDLASVDRDPQQNTDQEEPTDERLGEMSTCGGCDQTFDQLDVYVQHKKFECEKLLETSNHVENGKSLNYTDAKEQLSIQNNYVISGNLIMANDEDLAAEISNQTNSGSTSNKTLENDDMSHDDSVDSGGVKLESLSGTRVAMAQTMPEQESEDALPDSRDHEFIDKPTAAGYELPEESIDEQRETISGHEQADTHSDNSPITSKDEDEDDNDSEKLRKEILATEAMAQAIQNMTAFASQSEAEEKEKPDIGAIKYQVRMIQQQQAYQVQMLNFLQWQLALASSNPQAAVAAGTAANSRSAGINGFGMNQTVQPPMPMFPGAGGFTAPGFMPQMMAMAMNNFQNAGSENHNMAELAKARLMMSMQTPMANNDPKYHNIYTGTQSEMIGMADQEQRYQLKATNEDENRNERKVSHDIINEHEDKPDVPPSPTAPRQPKSDSGYDDDARSGSHGNGTAADDASSSHESQEDGELRDSVLKGTAEEHRHRCRYCHKVFGSDSALQIHIRSHTGERPFKCNICGNRFTTKGNLKVHFTRHKSKYPHIPMNNQPVPEYLDHVPTSNGVPYGMSILPEKAVLERPRLHGNPSIHLNPQQSTLSQREAHQHGMQGFFMPHTNSPSSKPESESMFGAERPDFSLANGMAPADVASAIQAQLLQRRRAEYLESQWTGEGIQKQQQLNELNEMSDHKNPMSILQAAMLPFLPGIAARQHMEAMPPHLRYLQHLHAMQAQNAANGLTDKNNNPTPMRLPTLPRNESPLTDQQYSDKTRRESSVSEIHKMVPRRQPVPTPSSETSKLQRLVENIDKGRTLQKNECHMCHRILSCQSALKLHYRTHTGERPYKCDLCSRAFTTRGNLRTHYSSVHRQQMRPLPPGGQASRAAQQEPFACSLCPARFREAVEFQHHMQMHAMVQARQQQQQQMLAIERENQGADSPSPVDLSNRMGENDGQTDNFENTKTEVEMNDKDVLEREDREDREKSNYENDERRDCDNISVSRSSDHDEERENTSPGENSPFIVSVKNEPSTSPTSPPRCETHKHPLNSPTRISPSINPLDSLAALSNFSSGNDLPQHTGSMLDHQLAALSRARAGRLTVCEICEKPFSCQSALEIHLRTHTKERPFMCQICQRAFTTKGNLKQHLLTHNITDIPDQMLMPVGSPTESNSASTTPSTSPTPSEAQKYGLKRPADLSDDCMDPAAKRTFPRHWCHICQKQFSSASSLQIHNRTHTGEKPFSCNVCGRAFTTKGNLKVHMGTHVWGAGGSRRGRRISMDNPLISPWMKNMTRSRPTQPAMVIPASGHVSDPAALYQQYAAIASGLLTAKQGVASRFMLPVTNGQAGNSANSASSPVSSSGSPLPQNEMTSPQNRVNGAMPNPAMSAATEWFLKTYQRTQEQVN